MAYTSGFFDAVDQGGGDYDREYSAATFAHYFSLLVQNGVFPDPSTGMQVKASTSPDMHVSVQPGSGWVNGYYITVETNAPEQLTIPTANPSLSRIDSVIMGLNYVNREVQLYIKSGAVSASPSAVSLQRDNDLYELELAQITVSAGMASITQANITDMRSNTSRCGIVKGMIDQIDTTDLFAQYDAAFQAWFEDIKTQLSGDVATSLQNQITALKDDKVNISDKASTSQAQAGTDNTKWMTPSLVKDFHTAFKATQAEVTAGTLDTKWVSPLRLQEKMNPVLSRVTNLENKMGNQEKELNRQAYDLYTLWLKDYYLNGAAWSPQAQGAKAILFDGFTNSSYVDTANTTAFVKTQQINFPGAADSQGTYPDGITATLGSKQSGGGSNPQYAIDRDPNTGFSWSGGASGTYVMAGIRITLPSSMGIQKIIIKGTSGGFMRTRLRYFYTSTDGTNFTLAQKGTNFLDSSSGSSSRSWTWEYTPTANIRAIEFWADAANQSGSARNTCYINSIEFVYTNMFSTKFNTITYSLPQEFKKAKLFISASSFSSLIPSAKLGNLTATLTQVSSRDDPMFSGFTEREYDLLVDSAQATLLLTVASVNGLTTTATLKRYGVYFIE